MKVPTVRLPDKPLLEPEVIAQAIVDAKYPEYEPLHGMDCVIGTRVLMAGISLPVAITEAQREEIVKLLPQLPTLHGKMLDVEIETFLEAFKKLAPMCNWIPSIVNEDARLTRKERREHFRREYFLDLKRSVDESKLIAVNGGHIRCKVLSVGAFIPYKEAVRYLEDSGHVLQSTGEVRNFHSKAEATNRDASTAEPATLTGDHNHVVSNLAQKSNTFYADRLVTNIPEIQSEVKSTLLTDQLNLKNRHPKVVKKAAEIVNSDLADVESKLPAPADDIQGVAARNDSDKFIDLIEVMGLIGYGKTTVYAMMDEKSPAYDPSFPKDLPKRPGSSATRWSLNAIQTWQAQQKEKPRSTRTKSKT